MTLNGKTILVTGGTGSFGSKLLEAVLERHDPHAIRVFSRDELKQSELRRRLADDERLRYLIGDVRDLPRLTRAMRGVDVVVHAAALKQVPACEYNPFEAVQTNVVGAENVVSAAIENDVPLTIALSSDKAVNPVNLYGATKLCAEKIITQGNAYAGDSPARFASVRYGNVVGSRGSVIPLFKAQAPTGVLTITDERMTRFWITLEQAVDFVLDCLGRMGGGEIFVPEDPEHARRRHRRGARARRGASDHRHPPGREAPRGAAHRGRVAPLARDGRRLRHPARATPRGRCARSRAARPLPAGFRYSSDQNDHWLDVDELREMASSVEGRARDERASFRTGGRRSPTRTSTRSPRRSAATLITQGPRDRRVRGGARRRTSAPSTSSRSRTARRLSTAPPSPPGSDRATRSDHVPAQLRRLVELRALPGRAPALRRHLPATLEPRRRARAHARSASARARSSRSASPACRSTSSRSHRSATASS